MEFVAVTFVDQQRHHDCQRLHARQRQENRANPVIFHQKGAQQCHSDDP